MPRAMTCLWILANQISTWLARKSSSRGNARSEIGMLGQKLLDEFGFMGREIISDNVDLAFEGLGGHYLGKKVDELGAGMALSSLAKDFSASGIESSVQGKSSVAVILKTMSFGPAWRKGQNRIQAVQGLDSTLFVHAKDGGMIRRGKIEADNVGGLLLKVGILAQHVTAQSVRLKAVASPNPRNGHVIGAAGLGGQPTAAPVGRSRPRGPRRVHSKICASSFAASGRTLRP